MTLFVVVLAAIVLLAGAAGYSLCSYVGTRRPVWHPDLLGGMDLEPPPGWQLGAIQYTNDHVGTGRDSLTLTLLRDLSW